jgi:hypothetical protein
MKKTKEKYDFIDMSAEVTEIVRDLRDRYGAGPEVEAHLLMALCLTTAQLCSAASFPASTANGYVESFLRFLDSLSGKEGAPDFSEYVGKGVN